jgi:hypothetical protein
MYTHIKIRKDVRGREAKRELKRVKRRESSDAKAIITAVTVVLNMK